MYSLEATVRKLAAASLLVVRIAGTHCRERGPPKGKRGKGRKLSEVPTNVN